MKFVCEGMILADATLIVSKACATKPVNPVMECIKISAKNDALTLTAYDGEISIEKQVPAEVLEEGEVCVKGKFFSDFLNKVSFAELVVSSDETGIKIEYGDSESYIQYLPASEFPIINKDMGEEYFEAKEEDLKDLISKVVFCCATDESRPILKGCLLEAKDNVLYAVALDGYRMACSYCQTTGGTGNMKIICPARTLNEISRMLGGEDTLKLYVNKNTLSVAVKNTVFTSRLYVGEFISKEKTFPLAFATTAIASRTKMIESLERACVVNRGDEYNRVFFEIKDGKVRITTNSDIGKVDETITAETEGKELLIAVNGRFIMDALKALEEEDAVMSFNAPSSPFTVENVESKRDQYLILPLRTGANAGA